MMKNANPVVAFEIRSSFACTVLSFVFMARFVRRLVVDILRFCCKRTQLSLSGLQQLFSALLCRYVTSGPACSSLHRLPLRTIRPASRRGKGCYTRCIMALWTIPHPVQGPLQAHLLNRDPDRDIFRLWLGSDYS